MKKITLITLSLAGVLAIGASAQGNMMGQQKNMMGQQDKAMQSKMMRQQGMMNNRFANCHKRGEMMHGTMMKGMKTPMHIVNSLNLTNDQRFQISILRDEMKLEMKKLMYQSRKHRTDFLKGDKFDEDSFKNMMNEKHKKMLSLMTKNMKKMFSILDKEQIAELKKRMNKGM